MKTATDVDVTKNAQTFLKFLDAKTIDEVISKTRKLIVSMENLAREDRDEYLHTLDAITWKISQKTEKLTPEEQDKYMGIVMWVYDKATGKKIKIGGIAGFVIHHKILSLILLVAIIIVIVITKR